MNLIISHAYMRAWFSKLSYHKRIYSCAALEGLSVKLCMHIRDMIKYILKENLICQSNPYIVKTLGRMLCAHFRVHFDMSHDLGGPKFHKILKHAQHSTGCWPIVSLQFDIRHLRSNYNLEHTKSWYKT